MNKDEIYMIEAIKEAKKAFNKNEIPVGSIIVLNDNIISRAHNLTESKLQVTAHAEILAISKANKKLKNWRLNDCIIYTTLEPCSMCSEVIRKSKIKKVVYLLDNNEVDKYYAGTEKMEINKYEKEVLDMFNSFFKNLRKKQ